MRITGPKSGPRGVLPLYLDPTVAHREVNESVTGSEHPFGEQRTGGPLDEVQARDTDDPVPHVGGESGGHGLLDGELHPTIPHCMDHLAAIGEDEVAADLTVPEAHPGASLMVQYHHVAVPADGALWVCHRAVCTCFWV